MFQKIFSRLAETPLEHNRKLLVILMTLLIIAGLVPRIIGLIALPGEFYHNDGGEYRDIAEQIANGNGFSISYYRWYEAVPDDPEPLRTDLSRTPVFPFLGALLYRLPFDWEMSAKATVLLISVLCILSVYLLGKETFSSKTIGFLAAGIYTFYPYSIYHSLCWSTENLFLLLTCIAYLFLLRSMKDHFCWKSAAWSGFFFALATLTRPQGAVLLLVMAIAVSIYFLISLKRDKKRAWEIFRGTAAFGIAAFLMFLPWTIRNYCVSGIPTPLSLYGPYSFAQSASDVSYEVYAHIDTPDYKYYAEKAWNNYHNEKLAILKEKGAFTLMEANPYWNQWAWEYIRNNPGKMWTIVKTRVLHCFRMTPNAAAISPKVRILTGSYFLVLALLMFAGLWFARKNIAFLPFLFPGIATILFAIPFQMVLRYRYPYFAPFAAILAAYGFYELCRLYYTKRRSRNNPGNGA